MNPETFCFGTFCSAHRAFLFAQGTVASRDPVAGADVNRLTPDAQCSLA